MIRSLGNIDFLLIYYKKNLKPMLYLQTFSIRIERTVNHQRPVNLDLGSLKYPPMAIASILHRMSGIVLFLFLPVMMYFLSQSLISEASFQSLQVSFASYCHKLFLLAFIAALIYHIFAGLRHVMMDLGFGEHLPAARKSAVFVMMISAITTIALGVWLW
jgi:succinate dehydrogenase / fumarate reductase, cytochrome b subunit